MKTKRKILALILVFITAVSILASCVSDDDSEHTHSYSDGFCSCGAEDPTYEPPHEHTFVEGKCECGATEPDTPTEPENPGTGSSSNIPNLDDGGWLKP